METPNERLGADNRQRLVNLKKRMEELNRQSNQLDVVLRDVKSRRSHVVDEAVSPASELIQMLPSSKEQSVYEQDLYELFHSKSYKHQILYPEIKFNFQIERGLRITQNVSELFLAIHTLLTNAIEATHQQPDPKIEMVIVHHDGKLVLAVIDNGVGVPDEIKENIFEPFFTTKESANMAGLGLYTIQRMISKIKGSIEVKDNPEGEGGAIFTVVIPTDNSQRYFDHRNKRVA